MPGSDGTTPSAAEIRRLLASRKLERVVVLGANGTMGYGSAALFTQAVPEVIFLAEAFTRPRVMQYLAKAGFNQSYTYFTWRNSASELREYLTELTLPLPSHLARVAGAIRSFWETRLGQYVGDGEEGGGSGYFSIPFVDYARGLEPGPSRHFAGRQQELKTWPVLPESIYRPTNAS